MLACQRLYFTIIHLVSLYPEIYDFRMKHSAISAQQSAKTVSIIKFLLKAESYMLIPLIRKWVFIDYFSELACNFLWDSEGIPGLGNSLLKNKYSNDEVKSQKC